MSMNMVKGLAVGLLAVGVGLCSAYASTPGPGRACTVEEEGSRVQVGLRIYECSGERWSVYAICDRQGRCTVV